MLFSMEAEEELPELSTQLGSKNMDKIINSYREKTEWGSVGRDNEKITGGVFLK